VTKEVFQEQIKRLADVYGPKAYPSERVKVLWLTFNRVGDEQFIDSVSYLIMNFRAAPLIKEFSEVVNSAETRRKEQLRQQADGTSMLDILNRAYHAADYSDAGVRERVEKRMKLAKDYSELRITKKQFVEGCDFLDRAGGIDSGLVIAGMKNRGHDFLNWRGRI